MRRWWPVGCALAGLLLAAPVGAASPLSSIDGILGSNALPGSQVSALAYDLTSHRVLYAQNPSLMALPASTLKLFVTAAALQTLGPNWRFDTTVQGGTLSHGVLSGSLVLVGGGDPSLTGHDLRLLARQVAGKVRVIRGGVRFDTSVFAGPGPIGWEQQDAAAPWYPVISGLTLDQGKLTVTVTPTTPGQRPQIALTPVSDFAVDNTAVTVPAGASSSLWVSRTLGPNPVIEVTGRIAQGTAPVQQAVSLPAPAHAAVSVFENALRADGVSISGATAPGRPAHQDVVLAQHHSAPLEELLTAQNRRSINLYAESVLRALTLKNGPVGTAAAGEQVIQRVLRADHLPTNLKAVDGCGLSLDDRVSAQDLVALLRYARRAPWGSDFWSTLPQSDTGKVRSGTLGSILALNGIAPAVRAKTGNVRHAENLAGYVQSPKLGLIAFAVLVRHVPVAGAGFRAAAAVTRALYNGS